MARALYTGLAFGFVANLCGAQDTQQTPDSRTVLGGGNEYLSAGADAIRAGSYEDGIRLTALGLQRSPSSRRSCCRTLESLCSVCGQGRPRQRYPLLHGIARVERQQLARLQ